MSLTIGVLARKAGVGIQTVRFYEREGLLHEPARNKSGYRTYDEGAVSRLTFIRRAQELGFTLREIRELIDLQESQSADCDAVMGVTEAKLKLIDRKIADLTRMRSELQRLSASCSARGPIARCAIMECLGADVF